MQFVFVLFSRSLCVLGIGALAAMIPLPVGMGAGIIAICLGAVNFVLVIFALSFRDHENGEARSKPIPKIDIYGTGERGLLAAFRLFIYLFIVHM